MRELGGNIGNIQYIGSKGSQWDLHTFYVTHFGYVEASILAKHISRTACHCCCAIITTWPLILIVVVVVVVVVLLLLIKRIQERFGGKQLPIDM